MGPFSYLLHLLGLEKRVVRLRLHQLDRLDDLVDQIGLDVTNYQEFQELYIHGGHLNIILDMFGRRDE